LPRPFLSSIKTSKTFRKDAAGLRFYFWGQCQSRLASVNSPLKGHLKKLLAVRLKPYPDTNPSELERNPCNLARRRCRLNRMIRQIKSGEFRLYSRKKDPKTGKRRNLGTFSTRKAAEKHEKDVQYFKRAG
jgi:hypothetical protein